MAVLLRSKTWQVVSIALHNLPILSLGRILNIVLIFAILIELPKPTTYASEKLYNSLQGLAFHGSLANTISQKLCFSRHASDCIQLDEWYNSLRSLQNQVMVPADV